LSEPDGASLIADQLIDRFGSIPAVLSASPADRADATASAPRVGRLLDVVRRMILHALRHEASSGPIIGNHDALIAYLQMAMAHEPREQLRALFLNARNELLSEEVIFEGSVRSVQMPFREILHRALLARATALVIVHNHPSGDPRPSKQDIEATRALIEAAAPLDIVVHDHLVVARSGVVSLRASGLLDAAVES